MIIAPKMMHMLASTTAVQALRQPNQKRADPSPVPVPQRINIPLSLDEAGRYVVGVNMSTGASEQQFKFALSLGTPYTVVAGSNCTDCSAVPGYDITSSTTAKTPFNSTAVEKDVVLDLSSGSRVTGRLFKEDCKLITSTGGGWAYPNQTVLLAQTASAVFADGVSGVLGLGTGGHGPEFANTLYSPWMSRNPNRSNFTFGMSLDAPQATSRNGGVLHWLSPDTNAYNGQMSFKSVPTSESRWSVEMDGWAVKSGGTTISREDSKYLAVLDPYHLNVVLALDAANLIYAGVAGAVRVDGPVVQTWNIPCNTRLSFSATFGANTFTLDESVLVADGIRGGSNGNGSCFGAIQGWTDSTNTDYLLGSTFLSATYLVFVVSSGNTPDSIGFGTRSTSKREPLSLGATAGIALGSIAVAALIALLAWFCYRGYRKKKQAAAAAEDTDEEEGGHPIRVRKSRHRNILISSSTTTTSTTSPIRSPSYTITRFEPDGYPFSPGTPQSWPTQHALDSVDAGGSRPQYAESTAASHVALSGAPSARRRSVRLNDMTGDPESSGGPNNLSTEAAPPPYHHNEEAGPSSSRHSLTLISPSVSSGTAHRGRRRKN